MSLVVTSMYACKPSLAGSKIIVLPEKVAST